MASRPGTFASSAKKSPAERRLDAENVEEVVGDHLAHAHLRQRLGGTPQSRQS